MPHATEGRRAFENADSRPAWSRAEGISLALVFGAVLYLLRSAAVIAGHPGETDLSVAMARWHVGLTIERAFPVALLVAAIAVALALRLAARPSLATLAAAALFAFALSGLGVEPARHASDPFDARDRALLLQQVLVAIALALLLVRAARRVARLQARLSARSRRILLAVSTCVALAVPSAAWTFCRAPPAREVRSRVAEYLSKPSEWRIVRSNPAAAPQAGFLAPSLDAGIDGAELPSLILPPPCEVRLRVPDVPGELRFRASAGVDRRFPWQLEHAPRDASVALEIAVEGEARFSERFLAGPLEGGDGLRAWRHAGGDPGLPVRAGQTITLRSELSPPDATVAGKVGLLCGFGNVEIERTEERPCQPATREHPNVVLVVMDTLRADELSCYRTAPPWRASTPADATPSLDALASRGLLFERAYATSSWTWPSTASILTGLVPEVHGVLDDTSCYLAASVETIGEALEREDYATAAFACNPLLDPVKNFDQGFETYDYAPAMRKSEEVLPRIGAWIEEHADARFFLYVHLVDTHEPVEPRAQDLARVGASATAPPGSPERPALECRNAMMIGGALTPSGENDPELVIPAERRAWLRDTYAAAVSTADRNVGTILGWLDEHGLSKNTIVAFTSDHGEELFDHGLLGHDHSLYQELVRVPMILAGPGIERGRRVGTPVSNRHLAWTLAARAGGRLRGPSDPIDLGAPGLIAARKVHFSTEHGWWWNDHRTTILGVVDWPFVLHLYPEALPFGAPKGTPPGEGISRLFDLETDPREKRDLSTEKPEIVAALKEQMLEHRRVHAAQRDPTMPGSGDATKDLLRRLGYAGGEPDDR